MERTYLDRVVDSQLDLKLRAFGAVSIVGPKWCGKTTTALQRANSALNLQKDPNKEGLICTAQINLSALLKGDKPRLIDEWQDAPNLWDAVRAHCDEDRARGQFILTGSTSKRVETAHTGTGRISKLKMRPMSLFESQESNGSVSLRALFDGQELLEDGCSSDLTIDDLVFAASRGGWPESVLLDDREAQLVIPRDYVAQVCEEDILKVDGVKRSATTMRAVLHLADGRYALIEFKLGSAQVEEGISHLGEIESLVSAHNERERQCPLRLPDLKMVVTGAQYGYRDGSGVFVVPVGCLKD